MHLRAGNFLSVLGAKGISGRVVSHFELLAGRVQLSDLLDTDTIIRIETAGEDFPTEKELIRLGAKQAGPPTPRAIDRMGFDKGHIRYPQLWYKGWCRHLQKIRKTALQTGARFMNDPEDIMLMFDKRAVHQLFVGNAIPVAKDPSPHDPVMGFDHLVQQMQASGIFRVFVKLRYGSGAMGIVALETTSRLDRFSAKTTLEMIWGNGKIKLYNTKKFFTYRKLHEIGAIIDFLCSQGVHVEQWIPKSYIDGGPFDIRQLVIGGTACHQTARIGRGPFTNLHLRSKRKSIDPSWMPNALIARVKRAAQKAAALFPGSFYAGVDILIPRGAAHPRIIEINAFGDFIKDCHYQGKDPYTLEVERWIAACQSPEHRHETAVV